MADFWVHFWPVWEWAKSAMALLGLGGLTIGGAAAVGYGLFKWLGEKWIDQKFEKHMEAYKTEQSRELERLRHKINSVFDRTIRLHTKEFEVLPDLWGKLVEAHGRGRGFVSDGQYSVDIERMDDQELAEYLEGTPFTESQKRGIKEETRPLEKAKLFTSFSNHYRHRHAQERATIFAKGLRMDGIFVQPEIKADMDKMLELIEKAVSEKRINCEIGDHHQWKKTHYERFEIEVPPLLEKIEKAISGRLWEATTTAV
ncbi:hypothetical protein [Rhizobium ruizarguesonis]|uniref:hypothetical protein n=1 Tax=Rhizobium ruizarguesonis TaxID=2081791 RepID=UPI001031A814|nr:hypothetical protein [Rhizobium ruizarguesonis]TAU29154.1 hypothetical protein ELI48_24985 [Rhizobium ruizarguesonis]TAU71154.1 hypothetical protein ELI45_26620 [Rhizobium ruizarguesonis]TAV18289.1 hypothetical protein ELI34_24310 [Rhizobium ruizarguesonis]TAV30529.1 hypothetical protein ELI35_24320 [Rhizobium ruizarguesonis]TAW12466.1 hypothetical protein ELI26_24460 [Rhizobium ruizarguesonis]